MRLVSFIHAGMPGAGVAVDGGVVPLDGITELGFDSLPRALTAGASPSGTTIPLAEITLRPVIPHPRRLICVGLNYHAHIEESKRETGEYPVLFTKFASSLIGANDAIVLPPESDQVDYEAELAVVIGRAGRRIRAESAFEHIAGYTVANDVTMRDYQYKTHQWLQGKSWDNSTPLGPELVTADEFGSDPSDHVFPIRLVLNGKVLQESDTSFLIYDIPTLVATISEFTALEPGDVILTGTPGGVGFRRDPQVFLAAGDVVRVEIDGVGVCHNTVVSERSDAR
jgi:acylpyruvate hydrolase